MTFCEVMLVTIRIKRPIKNLFLQSVSHISNCNYSISSAINATNSKMQPALPKRSYQEAIETLNNLQTNANYLKKAHEPKPVHNLSEVKKFLERTGITQTKLDTLPVIHVAGTNGKGTTCACCERILNRHGFKTGFYSSPHLLDVRERIRINGQPMSKKKFAEHFWKIYDSLDAQKSYAGDMPMYFRYLTILAFHVFFEEKVDVAILEVGIGGEYDCTNIVRKTAVAAITPLDFDHTGLLGSTIESIAWNKAGIMKEGCQAFTVAQKGEALKVLMERSLEKKCSLTVLPESYLNGFNLNVPSHVQKNNAALALAISQAFIEQNGKNGNGKQFLITEAKKAVEETRWPGRYEIKVFNNIRYFVDGAHTIESIIVCVDWFKKETNSSKRKKALIFNLTGNRNAEVFFKELQAVPFEFVIFIPNVGSDKDAADTKDVIQPIDQQLLNCQKNSNLWLDMSKNRRSTKEKVKVLTSFLTASKFLENQDEFDVLVTGSIHLIGATLSVLDPTLNGTLRD